MEGRKHDSGMRGLLRKLQQHAHVPNGNILCIYRNPAHSLRRQLLQVLLEVLRPIHFKMLGINQ